MSTELNKKDNLRSNIGYQSIYQIVSIITPIITSPYISRVLGAPRLGDYSYTSSIVGYFSIIALLGTSTYGIKEIAGVKESRKETSKVFWEIYSFQFLSSFISILIFVVFALLFGREYKSLFLCQSLTVIGIMLDINWLYFGLEEFKYTIKRNIIAKVISLSCIFAFVKSSNDLLLYAILISLANCLGNAFFWITLPKKIDFIKIDWNTARTRVKPNLVLFIPILATSVFHVMDKIMLGIFSDSFQSGYYYNASKMMDIPLSVVTGLSTVLLARMSAMVKNNSAEGGKQGALFITIGVIILFPMSFGVAAVSPTFCPWFFGPGYDECVNVLVILCVAMIFKGVSALIRSVYLIPYSMNAVYLSAVIVGAFLNIIANTVLIKGFSLGARGAALGTVLAEMVVCLIQFLGIIKYKAHQPKVNLELSKSTMVYLVFASSIMFVLVRLASYQFVLRPFVSLILQAFTGGAIYIMFLVPVILMYRRLR